MRFGTLPTGTTATGFITVASITDTESSAELETKEAVAVWRECNPVRCGADRRLPRFLAHRQQDMAKEPQVWQRIGKHCVVDGAVDPQALAVRCDSNAVTGRRLVSTATFGGTQVRQPDPFHLLSRDEIHDRDAVKLRELYKDPLGRPVGVRLDGHRPYTRLEPHCPRRLIGSQIEPCGRRWSRRQRICRLGLRRRCGA